MSTNVIYDRDTSNDLVYDGSSFVTPTFYVSNLSDGTTTYAIKDAEARTSLAAKQDLSNLVTSVSSSSTDTQYPSAKLFYDTCGDIESLINAL